MTDEELILQSAGVPTMYLDGFGAFRKTNGVLRCIGYVIDGGAQLNLIISLAGAYQAQAETRRVLEEKASREISMWAGATAH